MSTFDRTRRRYLTDRRIAKPTWDEAMEVACALVRSHTAVYRPQVQCRPDGGWNVWWVEAS